MGERRASSDNMSILVYGIIVIGSAILLPILVIGIPSAIEVKERRENLAKRIEEVYGGQSE